MAEKALQKGGKFMPNPYKWAIIAHGGAKTIKSKEEQSNRDGLNEAIKHGIQILSNGGTALDAVEEVVEALELNPVFNAGLHGSAKNEEGKIEMDASIMDGETLDIGAVASIENIEHPVLVARTLLYEDAILLVGNGANKFAREKGFKEIDNAEVSSCILPKCDTVGCVARDQFGNIAVATSTGGLDNTKAGRVGDVPLPGCGFYADNSRGGISASGKGEAIARVMLASECLYRLKDMEPDKAATQALELLERVGGEGGLITINTHGKIGWSHNSSHFAVGLANSINNAPQIFLKKSEENA
jgi:beta-aspartyl-peptidase (threonine type)